MRTLTTTIAIGLAVVAPAAGAQARKPVTRAEVSAVTHRLAEQSATNLRHSRVLGIRGRHERRGQGRPLTHECRQLPALQQVPHGRVVRTLGTNTVNGDARTLWCVGYVEFLRAKSGRTRVMPGSLICPVS